MAARYIRRASPCSGANRTGRYRRRAGSVGWGATSMPERPSLVRAAAPIEEWITPLPPIRRRRAEARDQGAGLDRFAHLGAEPCANRILPSARTVVGHP